jgi:hypothetical protein
MDTLNPEPEPPDPYEDPGNPYDYHRDAGNFTLNMFLCMILMVGSCRFGSEVYRCWTKCTEHLRIRHRVQEELTIRTNLITEESLSETLLTECPICLETYQKNENVANLPCHHIFHVSCIKGWFENHTTCPVCRDNLMLRVHEHTGLGDTTNI